MAVIAISRQVAALGDEICTSLAKELGYDFINRKMIEKRIIELGFSAEKLKRYDERKPGFFASLVKDRDEYLDYLQTAILEAAVKDNCILIGRGSFAILEKIPNVLSVRFVAADNIRCERLMNEFNWNEKQAFQRINESDQNRAGFHNSFFNIDNTNAANYHMVLNTGIFDEATSVQILKNLVQTIITPEKEEIGKKLILNMYDCQKLTNELIFKYKLCINYLHATMHDNVVELHGVADSSAISEKAVMLSRSILPDKEIKSCISVVQDFKAYS